MKIRIKDYFGDLVDLTLGKSYEVTHDFGDGDLAVEDDDGFWVITRAYEPCSFLNGGSWEVVSE